MNAQSHHLHRRQIHLLLLLAVAGGMLPCRHVLPQESLKLTVTPGLEILVARDVRAVTSVHAADESVDWIAALEEGGLLVRNDATAEFQILPDHDAGALAAWRQPNERQEDLVVALAGGGIIRLDIPELQVSLLSEMHAVALAAGDVDADGEDEIVLARDAEGIFLLDAEREEISMVSTHQAIDLAIGDYLGRGDHRIAMLRADGSVLFLNTEFEVEAIVAGVPITAIASGDLDEDGADSLLAMLDDGNLLEIDIREETAAWLDLELADLEVSDPFLSYVFLPPLELDFIRGDTNNDITIDVSDAVHLLLDLFLGQRARAPCRDALDVNDDGTIDISDAVYLLRFQFSGGRPIPPPYPEPALDPTRDAIPPCDPVE